MSSSSTSSSSTSASASASTPFRIASWNILAQSYTFSHNASTDSLSWPQRGERILDRIRAQDAELLCLQEVDHYSDFFRDRLSQLGYECRYAARSGQLSDDDHQTGEYDGTPLAWRDRSSSKRCKMDGLLLAWKKDRFEIDSAAAAPTAASSSTEPLSQVLGHHIVDFDDLAYAHEELRLLQNNASSSSNAAASTQSTQLTKYLRHNIGQFVFLRSITNPSEKLLLANIHLYWNPMHEEVKLKQVMLMMERMEMECKLRNEKNSTTTSVEQITDAIGAVQLHSSEASPSPSASSTSTSATASTYPNLSQYRLILAGDFNSSPASKLYNYITQGVYEYKDGNLGPSSGKKNWNTATSSSSSSSSSSAASSFNSPIPLSTSSAPSTHTPRFICDCDLIKVAKWLRSIGIDCAHYTEEEKKSFSYQGLFTRAIKENRIIITSSVRLIERRGCPPYFHLKSANLEVSFASLIVHYSLQFQTEYFYSRCIFCNSGFQEFPREYFLGGTEEKTGITYEPHMPFGDIPMGFVDRLYTDEFGHAITFLRCKEENAKYIPCGKVFWWGSRSGAAEEKFAERIEKALAQQQREDMNDGVDGTVENEKKEGEEGKSASSSSSSSSKPRSISTSRIAELKLASSIALRTISLDSTLVPQQSLRLKSAYASASSSGSEEPEFTNLTATFYDTLDYIFYRDPVQSDSTATAAAASATPASSSTSSSAASSSSSLHLSSVHPLLEATQLDLAQLAKNGVLKASTVAAAATTAPSSTAAADPPSIVLPNSSWPSDHLLIQATFTT